MPRLRWFLALAAVAALACAGVASATPLKVTGGTTQFSFSSPSSQALVAHNLTFTPIAPATGSGSTLTFPVRVGSINAKTLRGRIVDGGRLIVSNGAHSLQLRRPSIVARGKHSALVSAMLVHRGKATCTTTTPPKARRCTAPLVLERAVVGSIRGITVSGTSATGTMYPSRSLARWLDRLAGAQVASPSMALGTVTVAVTTA